MKIMVNGVNLARYWVTKSLRIRSAITRQIDTCELEFVDRDGVAPDVQEKHEIIISNDADTERYFGGYVASIDMKAYAQTRRRIVSCQDYSILLETKLVNEIYESQTDNAIILDLFATYLPGIDVATYVETSVTIDRIVFPHVTLREALERVCEVSGFDWYVDYNEKLHYFAEETNLAPFDLLDTEVLTHPHKMRSYVKDARKIENRILVLGGIYWSGDTDFELPADNQTTEFLLPYRFKPPVGQTQILTYENIGNDVAPNWSAVTVGVDYLDTLGVGLGEYDTLYNFQEKLLKWNVAPPNLLRAMKITARYEVPVILRVHSDASYTEYGRWFDGKVVDENITTRDLARQRGKAHLAEWAFAKEQGIVVCWTSGLYAGQRIRIVNALRSIDGYYLIRSVDTRFLGGTARMYIVEFGEYNPDLVDMLMALKRSSEYRDSREDEMLNECFELAEAMAITETSVTLITTGLTYYASPCPGQDPIKSGFWVAS